MNTFKTLFLMAVLTGIVMAMGLQFGQQGMTYALIFAAVMNFGAYFWSDKLVLSMSHAQEVGPDDMPWYHEIINDLSMKSGLPKPKLYIINNPSPNAFATGRNPKHAAVAVTTGLVRLLNKEELEGVIAHELAHVQNRDILTGTIVTTAVAAITWIATMLRWTAIFGGFGGRDDDENGGSNPLALIAMAVLFPLAATVVQLAISRTREYAADEAGARMCKKPWALANALRKIENGVEVSPMDVNPASAHMYIMKPFGGRGGLLSLFTTHPPTEKRIERLMSMTV